MYVIDTLAKEFKDPLIMAHWNCLNNPTQSCVKVNIMTHGYETICRTALVVHVGHKTLKAICREGRVVHMSYEPQELRDLILCKIAQHQVNAVLSLSKLMSWQILSSSSHSGVGTVEPLGNAFTVSLASPNGDRVIALRYGAQTGVQVLVQSSPRKDFYPSQLVKDLRWENLGGNYREVRWDRMEGRSFVNKMELLMSSLTTG
jgi:mediator of RNA polymerase II transcription subunit 17